ncbi:sensor histidine kinase [Brachybacterium alimentarium]|uniref:sensor histidine kinase n=1 Tax=Brachybacterium alimentarium TaxID=47845 RepID=UPI000DF1A58B|nr:histidine kinase [Brachybacterium alimentarium]RCS80351.1 sensor histidine kinase [Brachybacterium alimentarium]RCS83048.1 sensor histidine kinase [Brachybacterium alimentarium]
MFLVPDRHSLRRLGHDLALVLPGLALTLLSIVLLLPLAAVSAALAIVWIGLLLFPLTLSLASVFARLDRSRLRRWGLEMREPRYQARGRGATGLLRLVTDPRRWLDLAFEALIALPVRVLTVGATVAWAALALGGLTFWFWGRFLPDSGMPVPGQWALALVLGLALALSFPAMVHALALLDIVVSAPLLGGAVPGSPRRTPFPSIAGGAVDTRVREGAWTWMTVAFVSFVLVVVSWPVTAALYDVHPAAAMLVSIAAALAGLLAVRWPWAGLALSVLAALSMMLVTAPVQASLPWPWPVTSLLAHCLTLTVLAILHRWYWSVSAWSGGALLTLVSLLITEPRMRAEDALREITTNGVVLVAISGGVVLLGLTVRQWLLVSGQVEQAQTLSADQVRRRHELEERSRIARELHDVVAHSMSVITVQAGTAKFRLPGMDSQTEQEFEDIAASSRQALGEMRSLLATLRTDDSLDEMPMPGLGDVPELLEASRATGASISADLSPADVPPTVGLTAYRVVQEALSNALRHSRGAAIRVRVVPSARTLLVEIANTAPDTGQDPIPGSGLGLTGARERVTALGGTVEAGPSAGGGFIVSAEIPIADPLPG